MIKYVSVVSLDGKLLDTRAPVLIHVIDRGPAQWRSSRSYSLTKLESK